MLPCQEGKDRFKSYFRSVLILLISELFDGCARILPSMENDPVREAESCNSKSPHPPKKQKQNPSSVVLGAGARCTTTKSSPNDLCLQQVEF